MQKVRCHYVLQLLVGVRFQVPFHSPHGFFSPFPHGTCSLIGHRGIFRLGRWSCRFTLDDCVPSSLGILLAREFCFKVLGFHHLWLPLPEQFQLTPFFTFVVPQPPSGNCFLRFGLFAFARRYYRNHCLFLF